MVGTLKGGAKTRQTVYEKYGKDYYVNMGKIGGKAPHPKGRGFQLSGKASEAGRKGGLISKRGKAKK